MWHSHCFSADIRIRENIARLRSKQKDLFGEIAVGSEPKTHNDSASGPLWRYFNITQFGSRIGKAINPSTAVAAISIGLLTFHRNKTASDPTPMRAVSQSPIAIFLSRTQRPEWFQLPPRRRLCRTLERSDWFDDVREAVRPLGQEETTERKCRRSRRASPRSRQPNNRQR